MFVEGDDDIVRSPLEEQLGAVADDLLLLRRLQGSRQRLQAVADFVVVKELLEEDLELRSTEL